MTTMKKLRISNMKVDKPEKSAIFVYMSVFTEMNAQKTIGFIVQRSPN